MEKISISLEPGQRIRDLRKKLGLSRSQFEKRTGVSENTLRYLETGKRELSTLKAGLLSTLFICRFLFKEEEASRDFLLYGKKK
jgi:transcriptional regulator with XRE-family HTH domain